MFEEPEDPIPEAAPELTAAPATPAEIPAWEAEIEAFWQNILINVSSKVETPIHNYLHAEKEALKARLKQLF
jgi:hypothetical protein